MYRKSFDPTETRKLCFISFKERRNGRRQDKEKGKGNYFVTIQTQILNENYEHSRGKLLLGNQKLCRLKCICLNCLISLAFFEELNLILRIQTGQPSRM